MTMRVVYDNVADSSTLTLTSGAVAGNLALSNLLDDRKSKVFRTTGTTAQIVAAFPASKLIQMVCLAFSNLSVSATMRVRGWTSSGAAVSAPGAAFPDGTAAFDTNITAGVAQPPRATRADSGVALLGVNQASRGGTSYAILWFTGATVAKIAIDIADGTNLSGYLEAGRLICGTYWQPTFNADYGANFTLTDTTKNDRDDAGDLRSDLGVRAKKLSLNLSLMPEADRKIFMDLLHGNGLADPVFLSLYPADANKDLEQKHMVYGKFTQMSQVNLAQFNRWQWPLEVEEV
jgi:hypothetical protein